MSVFRHPASERLRRAWPRPAAVLKLWPWLPAVLAAAYALLFLLNFRSLVEAVYWHADVTSAPVIGELYGQAPHGTQVILGTIAWFPALWFELATHGLPAHRQIWELAPYVISLAGFALLAWSAYKAGGRWAAMIAAGVVFAASPALLRLEFAWSIHSVAYTEVAFLGAFLVLCVAHGGVIDRWRTHLPLVALAGLIAAVGLASDKLVAVAGLAPFLLAGLATLLFAPRRVGLAVAGTAITVTAMAVVGTVILHQVLVDDNITTAYFPITFAPYEQVGTHIRLLVESTAYLFYGDFGGGSLTFLSGLKFLCAAVVLAALVSGFVISVKALRRLVIPRGDVVGRADVYSLSGARATHIVFWSLVLCLTSLAYVFSSVPLDQFTGRYLVPAVYALAALLSVVAIAATRYQVAVVVGAFILMLAATIASARHELQSDPDHFPTLADSIPLERFARAEGLKYGYAGYWDAAPITWQTKTAIQVYPVALCGGPRLCPQPGMQIGSWYTPRPGIRTFLVTDSEQPLVPAPPQNSLGPPQQVVHINQLTVYVYGYDIASKFG